MAGTGVVIPETSIRFGDCELNASVLELRRGRRTVRLERIPLQVLLILIENQGKLVTREAIADQVWGKDVFVDVDNGINTAIRKIRQVLNDDPQKPKFVETIPGMGYRFIAPLEKTETRTLQIEPEIEEPPAATILGTARAEDVVAPGSTGSMRRGVWRRFGVWALAVLCVIGNGGWFGWKRFNERREPIRSIAVLPLQNLSGDPGEEYFSDGITDQLITDIAKIGSMRVISRTSIMQYKGTKKNLPEIGRELGVDAIVEGSVVRSGERVRVTAQLVQAHNDQHLWAETYDRDHSDILRLQADVADAIAQQVRAQLTPTQQASFHPPHVVNPAAYDAYLRGRSYFDNGFGQPGPLKQARRYFEEAIQIDPNFAPPYAGLANTYAYLAFAGVLPKDDGYRSARDALAKALQLDDSLGEAYDVLGVLDAEFDWDWNAADRDFSRAMALAPSYSCAHEDRAFFLATAGRRDEALGEIAKIDQLDYGSIAAAVESWTYAILRDYPNLIRASQRALLLNSKEPSAHYLLGVGYEGSGRLQEAITEYQKAVELSGDPANLVALAHAYGAVGRKAEAEKMLRDLERKLRGTPNSSFTMAKIYASLGENDRAFEFLERAYAEKSFFLPANLKCDVVLDTLRSDVRFQNLLRRMGLSS